MSGVHSHTASRREVKAHSGPTLSHRPSAIVSGSSLGRLRKPASVVHTAGGAGGGWTRYTGRSGHVLHNPATMLRRRAPGAGRHRLAVCETILTAKITTAEEREERYGREERGAVEREGERRRGGGIGRKREREKIASESETARLREKKRRIT